MLVAFNAPSLAKFGPTVRPGGIVLYDDSVVASVPDTLAEGVHVVGVPFADTARDLGAVQVKNIVALGALQAVTRIFPRESLLAEIRTALVGKRADLELNEQAFGLGVSLAGEAMRRVAPLEPMPT